jgi:hypothetical protein
MKLSGRWVCEGMWVLVALMTVSCGGTLASTNERGVLMKAQITPLITEFPEPTAGPAPTAHWVPTLANPVTQEEALQLAWEADQGIAKWDDPWTPETAQSTPGRITIEWHPNAYYNGVVQSASNENYPVWSVTINGPVYIVAPGWRGRFGGVTYDIYQKSGHLGGIHSLDPILE